jgi:hypothetical protein
MDIEAMEALTDLTRRRFLVSALVAPAIRTAAGNAASEHWTEEELIRVLKQVVARYRPRLRYLAVDD